MAHASFPGTDKHGEQILLPIPQAVGLRAGREPGSCSRRKERFCSCAEVRDRGLGSAEKPSAWSSCYRCVLGRVPEADGAGPARLPMLPEPGL